MCHKLCVLLYIVILLNILILGYFKKMGKLVADAVEQKVKEKAKKKEKNTIPTKV